MAGLRSRVALWVLTAALTTAGTVTAVNALASDGSSTVDLLSPNHQPLVHYPVTPSGESTPEITSKPANPATRGDARPPSTGAAQPSTRPPSSGSAGGGNGHAMDLNSNKVPDGAQSLTTDGGTILATCAAGKVTLNSWTPAAGYRVSNVEAGPATIAGLWFSTSSGTLKVSVSCDNNRAKARVTPAR